jgi:hypothetical protein
MKRFKRTHVQNQILMDYITDLYALLINLYNLSHTVMKSAHQRQKTRKDNSHHLLLQMANAINIQEFLVTGSKVFKQCHRSQEESMPTRECTGIHLVKNSGSNFGVCKSTCQFSDKNWLHSIREDTQS